MPIDLEAHPGEAVELCRTAYTRLLVTEQIHSSSRLPGWTVAHVLTHLARNAEGHARRLAGALRGEVVPRYPGGPAQRASEIDEGAQRSVEATLAHLETSQRQLDSVWDQSIAAGRPHAGLRADDHWPTTASPVRRLREVEIHHVDLGLGYEPSDWLEEYVAWELPVVLATVPYRVQRTNDARALLAWFSGRRSIPGAIELDPW